MGRDKSDRFKHGGPLNNGYVFAIIFGVCIRRTSYLDWGGCVKVEGDGGERGDEVEEGGGGGGGQGED